MTYAFGTFRFDSGSLELSREGREVRLEPQPARALALLLSRAGEVVTRDELRAAIWGEHTHVDYDRGLAYCASQIRTALGDSGENPRFLQTLPKRGFRFVAPVATEPAANQAPEPAGHSGGRRAARTGTGRGAVLVARPDGLADGRGRAGRRRADLDPRRHAAAPGDRRRHDLRQRDRRRRASTASSPD